MLIISTCLDFRAHLHKWFLWNTFLSLYVRVKWISSQKDSRGMIRQSSLGKLVLFLPCWQNSEYCKLQISLWVILVKWKLNSVHHDFTALLARLRVCRWLCLIPLVGLVELFTGDQHPNTCAICGTWLPYLFQQCHVVVIRPWCETLLLPQTSIWHFSPQIMPPEWDGDQGNSLSAVGWSRAKQMITQAHLSGTA